VTFQLRKCLVEGVFLVETCLSGAEAVLGCEEIIKEGRKFGVFLTIASQRPHDISPTIISQLHNYFLHRLVNDLDIRAIEKAVSYLDRVSFESMPILPTGVFILSGVAAQIPVMVTVSPLDPAFAPNSRTMSIVDAWSHPVVDPPRAIRRMMRILDFS
jgi:DNA helicase HerA-like ATPase